MNTKATETQKRSFRTTNDPEFLNEIVWRLLGVVGLFCGLGWLFFCSEVPRAHALTINALAFVWVLNMSRDGELTRQILDFQDWTSWRKVAFLALVDGLACATYVLMLYASVMTWAHVR